MLPACKAPSLSQKNGAFPVKSSSGGFFMQDQDVDDSPVNRSRNDMWKALRCVAPSTSIGPSGRDDDGSFAFSDNRTLMMDYEKSLALEKARAERLLDSQRHLSQSNSSLPPRTNHRRARTLGSLSTQKNDRNKADFVPDWSTLEMSLEDGLILFRDGPGDKANPGLSATSSHKTAPLSDEETPSRDSSSADSQQRQQAALNRVRNRGATIQSEERGAVVSATQPPAKLDTENGVLVSRTHQHHRRGYAKSALSHHAKDTRVDLNQPSCEKAMYFDNIDIVPERTDRKTKRHLKRQAMKNRSLPSLLCRIEKLETKLVAEGIITSDSENRGKYLDPSTMTLAELSDKDEPALVPLDLNNQLTATNDGCFRMSDRGGGPCLSDWSHGKGSLIAVDGSLRECDESKRSEVEQEGSLANRGETPRSDPLVFVAGIRVEL